MKNAIRVIICLFICLFANNLAYSGEVSEGIAKNVAENWLYHYVKSFGKWSDVQDPEVVDGEVLFDENGKIVAYNFIISPIGHIFVPSRDEFSPIKLFSDSKTLICLDLQYKDVCDFVIHSLSDAGMAIDSDSSGFDSTFLESKHKSIWNLFSLEHNQFIKEYEKNRC